MNNAQRYDDVYDLGCYLVKFQNASGHFNRDPTWPTVQSPFLSSSIQRVVEMQSWGFFALKAAKFNSNATLAFQALWDYVRLGDFGGN